MIPRHKTSPVKLHCLTTTLYTHVNNMPICFGYCHANKLLLLLLLLLSTLETIHVERPPVKPVTPRHTMWNRVLSATVKNLLVVAFI